MLSSYEEMMRQLLWPDAVAPASLIPHGHSSPGTVHTLGPISEGPGGFKVSLDVHQFAPHEITVKTTHDSIVVEGRHEERPDEHGYVTRHFLRRYTLGSDHDIDHVACALSSDGVLTVIAPKTEVHKSGVKTKNIPIIMHAVPAIKVHGHPHHMVKADVPVRSAKPASHHGLN